MTVRTDQQARRVTVIYGVAHDVDVDKVREVIRLSVAECDSVIEEGKRFQIFAQEFGESSINFEVVWWAGSKPVEVHTSRDQVFTKVERALDDAGIEIPFPYRTLTFKEPLKFQNEADARDS